MRVLHLTRDLPPRAAGGVSTAVLGLVTELAAGGIDCAVLSFDGWRPKSTRNAAAAMGVDREGGITVTRVHDPQQAALAIPLVAAWQPHLIHVHHDMLWTYAERMRSTIAGAATCCTIHVLQHELNRLRGATAPTLSQRGQEEALARADAVIAPSRAVESLLLCERPELTPRLHRIGFGARPAPHAEGPAMSPPMLLYSGRFADVKGTAELGHAADHLLAAFPDLELVVAGGNPEGPRSDRRWRRRLSSTVAPHLQPRLRLTGWLDRPQLDTLYRRARALLCPSWFESFGLAVLEALAHGVPVVASAAGALPELVTHEANGLLVTPRRVDELVEQAGRLVRDSTLATRLGQAAADRVEREFGWAPVVNEHQRLYHRLANHAL